MLYHSWLKTHRLCHSYRRCSVVHLCQVFEDAHRNHEWGALTEFSTASVPRHPGFLAAEFFQHCTSYMYINIYIGSHLVMSVFLLQEGGDAQKEMSWLHPEKKKVTFFGFKSWVPANLRNIPLPTGRVRFCLGIMSSVHVYFESRRNC